MNSKRNFNDLARPVLADPERAARVDQNRDRAVAEHIAYALNEIREAHGVTQDELAGRLGITQGAVSQRLRAVSNVDALSRYVAALGGKLELTVTIGSERTLIEV